MEMYQDIFSEGRLIQKGLRECSSRYEAIKESLSKYKRNFTLLDIGSNFGYFSIRAAHEFDCTSIMIQSEPESRLLFELCSKNKNLKLNLLNKRISCREINNLSKCERFDSILLLNVLHHLGSDWKIAFESCLKMCHSLIVETPSEKDKGSCGQEHLKGIIDFINNKDHTVLGEFSRHTDPNSKSIMVEIMGAPEKFLEKSYIDMPSVQKNRMGKIEILSDFEKKIFIKNKESQKWIHGINFHNFLKLNGVWPSRDFLISQIEERKITTDYKWDNTHRDITPWNFIINGASLNLIDLDGFNFNDEKVSDASGLEFTVQKVKTTI